MKNKKQLTQLGQDLMFLAEVIIDFKTRNPKERISVATFDETTEGKVLSWICVDVKNDINIWDNKKIDIPSEYYE